MEHSQADLESQRTQAEPQYMRALLHANRVRIARSELKRRIAEGEVSVVDVIVDCPWEASSMAIADLLMSQRTWGSRRTKKFLSELSIDPGKTVGTLTERQRRVLADACVKDASKRLARVPLWTTPRTEEWQRLVDVAQRHGALTSELAELAAERDALISALSGAGASRRAVAEAASLTVGRVQQIVGRKSRA